MTTVSTLTSGQGRTSSSWRQPSQPSTVMKRSWAR